MTDLNALPVEVRAQLNRLSELLLEGQTRLNLTAITDAEGIDRLHFQDSLAGLDAAPELKQASVAGDIGSGAGFPLLPLAILTPQCQWVALESVSKKARFIQETAGQLGLSNVEARPVRAEDAGRSDLRAILDVATARAVGPVAALAEVGLPLLKLGGLLLLYKTEAALAEADSSGDVLSRLGGTLEQPYRYRLTGDEQDRIILRIRKSSDTLEKYPRAAGVPFKKPLRG